MTNERWLKWAVGRYYLQGRNRQVEPDCELGILLRQRKGKDLEFSTLLQRFCQRLKKIQLGQDIALRCSGQ